MFSRSSSESGLPVNAIALSKAARMDLRDNWSGLLETVLLTFLFTLKAWSPCEDTLSISAPVTRPLLSSVIICNAFFSIVGCRTS